MFASGRFRYSYATGYKVCFFFARMLVMLVALAYIMKIWIKWVWFVFRKTEGSNLNRSSCFIVDNSYFFRCDVSKNSVFCPDVYIICIYLQVYMQLCALGSHDRRSVAKQKKSKCFF